MVPDPDRDAERVQHLPGVMGMHAVHDERHRATPVGRGGRADEVHAVDLGEAGEGAFGERVLVRGDAVHPHRAQVVDGRTEPHRLRRHRHAGLEALWRGRVARPSIRTSSIMDPPVRNGGIASSSSRRP